MGWVQTLLLVFVAGCGGVPVQAPSQTPSSSSSPASLAATLTHALQTQGLAPSALAQPSVDTPQATALFRRFMTAPEQAWGDVDTLSRLGGDRFSPGEVLRVVRQQTGAAEFSHPFSDPFSHPFSDPFLHPFSHPSTPLPITARNAAATAAVTAAVAVPAHIPQPLAGEIQSALNALAAAETWRQHAFRNLPADVSVTELIASALPNSNAPAHTPSGEAPHTWRRLAPRVDQQALHTGARIALAAAERLHAFVTQSPGLPAVTWRVDTPNGTVLVDTTGARNHHVVTHPLLLLDVGGDDHYELGGGASASTSAPTPGIRLLLDHGGNDHYRATAPGAGPSSAVLGYGIVWDTQGDDQHHGGWIAQGAALLGVALHIDDAGHNLLQATGLAQGFALGGTALLLGSPGDDRYRAQTLAQASAGPQGLALLLDPAGNDHYHLGNEVLVWPSSQLPDRNASMGQGAAFGTADSTAQPAITPLPGGVALLLDADGHDHYQAQVFAQGAGLRQGTGLLLDQAGHNRFEAAWYAMGAAAHQGVGLLWASGGGDDRYEVSHVTSMGAGHDEGVGVLVDAGGQDQFVLQDLGLGAAHDGGHGVLVRGLGRGVYRLTGTACRGMGQSYGSRAAPIGAGRGMLVDANTHRYSHRYSHRHCPSKSSTASTASAASFSFTP